MSWHRFVRDNPQGLPLGGARLVHFSVVSVIVLLDVFAHVPHLAQMRTTLNIEIGVGWGGDLHQSNHSQQHFRKQSVA